MPVAIISKWVYELPGLGMGWPKALLKLPPMGAHWISYILENAQWQQSRSLEEAHPRGSLIPADLVPVSQLGLWLWSAHPRIWMGKIHQPCALSQPDNQSPKKGSIFFQKGIWVLFGKGNRGRAVKNWPLSISLSEMSEDEQICLGLTGKRYFPHVCMDVNSREPRAPGLAPWNYRQAWERQHICPKPLRCPM